MKYGVVFDKLGSVKFLVEIESDKKLKVIDSYPDNPLEYFFSSYEISDDDYLKTVFHSGFSRSSPNVFEEFTKIKEVDAEFDDLESAYLFFQLN